MISFEAKDYVYSFAQEIGRRARGFVPVPIAAAAMGVQPTTVRAYVRSGVLSEVTITSGDEVWRGITLGSLYGELQRRQEKIDEIVDEIRPFLLERGPQLIEYGELMELVGLSWRKPNDRDLIGKALGELSKQTLENPDMKFLISANVVSKNTQRPNSSLYYYGGILGAVEDDESEEEFWQRQMTKIKKWHKAAQRGRK